MELGDFMNTIKNSNLTLVDFYADWCGPCKILSPIIDKVKQRIGDKVVIMKINVDESQFISYYYEIRSIPTLILFKNDLVIWRNAGVVSEEVLVNKLSEYL